MIEWDIAQILIQKDISHDPQIFDEITNQYVKLAEQEFARKSAGNVWKIKSKIMISLRQSDLTEITTSLIHMTLKLRQALQVIAQLKSGKTDQIEKAQVQIKADLPSPETILAVVYETGSKYRELDDVLSELEKRRAVAFSRITRISRAQAQLMCRLLNGLWSRLETTSDAPHETDVLELLRTGAEVARNNALKHGLTAKLRQNPC